MSSDEEDYMSEAFLTKCKDIQPGLIKEPSRKREHNILKRQTKQHDLHRKKHQSMKAVETERREQGLQESLGSDNKGYALLQKMGYKPGQGIGKTDSGRLDPISITVKSDRFGLGRASVLKEISERKAKKRAQRISQQPVCSIEDYRKRISEKATERATRSDLNKSQRACERLDLEKDIKKPDELWFWPERLKDPDSDLEQEEDEVDFEPSEKLKMLTRYLRECHLYCIWCGTQFDDPEDITSNCPGPTSDCH